MISVFENLNKFAGKSKILDGVAVFFARVMVYLMVLFLFTFAVMHHSRGIFVYPFFSGLCAAFIFDKIIYIFLKAKRPAEIKGTKVLIPIPKNPSFPSRHASLLFGISFYLFFCY